jgi:Uma2 family endonuclease
MSTTASLPGGPVKLPDHNDLPCEDGAIVINFLEHPQAMLLTGTLSPVLDKLHPDEQYAIGQDCGIYWKITQPPLKGAVAPDWFYVPNVPPSLDGHYRRSYVLWQELTPPVIVIEFVSGDGKEERDRTPEEGKFWIYKAPYYAIYEVEKASVEVYKLTRIGYRDQKPNSRGHFPIPELGIELGIWTGKYRNVEFPWLRAWDLDGKLLPAFEETAKIERQRADNETRRADNEKQRADNETRRADDEKQRAENLAAQLRALGVDPNA